jgi:alkanesulfonate monooxygenase SsuD/methylene tetrahydromethanopterin reductase-like flavin-dependent oxidoreductase (luciferase family)
MSAMVDQNSGGRLILGVGLGYQPQDFNHFAVPFNQRLSRFEESIEVLRRAWTEDRFSFAGKRFNYDNIAVYPKPLQSPHPPLWLAAWSEAGAVRAGRLGDAYVTDPIQSLAAVSAFHAAYRNSAAAAGRAPNVVLMREILCAPNREAAIERYGDGLAATYRYYWENDAFVLQWDDDLHKGASFDDIELQSLMRDRVVVGSPEQCVNDLRRWAGAVQADHIQLVVPPGKHERDLADKIATIHMLGESVAAPLKEK